MDKPYWPKAFVTIGAHHKGPHVDALYALAERCGALVLVVNSDDRTPDTLPLPMRRLPYAGFDSHEGAHRHHGWAGGAR